MEEECRQKEGSGGWLDFEGFKAKYGKRYSAEEEAMRKRVYENHVDELDLYEGEKYEVGINHMSDLTEAELDRMMGHQPGDKKGRKASSHRAKKGGPPPEGSELEGQGSYHECQEPGPVRIVLGLFSCSQRRIGAGHQQVGDCRGRPLRAVLGGVHQGQ